MEELESKKQPLNDRRRNLIKLGFFGVGTFALGKILGPAISIFPQNLELTDIGKETLFKNFRVVESNDELGIYDRLGNEILIIEKD